MVKVAIIGAGISSAFFGYKLKKLCDEYSIDLKLTYYSTAFNGGACADSIFETSDTSLALSTYYHNHGPHIFHTNNKDVWKLVNEINDFIPFNLHVHALMEGNIVPLPFSMATVEQCFPSVLQVEIEKALLEHGYSYGSKITLLDLSKHDGALKTLADYMYRHMFANYTAKQWGTSIDEIDPAVLDRVPFAFSRQTSYFLDRWQALPKNGYTHLINDAIEATRADLHIQFITANNSDILKEYDYVVSSSSIDEFFDYQFGELPYRTCEFKPDFNSNMAYHKNGEHVINYPNQYDYTRSVDYCNWYGIKNRHMTIFEYPKQWTREDNDMYPRYYPIKNKETIELYNKYKELADQHGNLIFIGRLGSYSYINMDTAIEYAIEAANDLFDKLFDKAY